MKFHSVFFFFFNVFFLAQCQFGSLKLDSKPNDQFQITSSNIFSPKSSTKMLKRITSLVNTPTFTINSLSSPEYPENLKYTETDDYDVYIIVLPHFQSFVTKDDVIVETGVGGMHIRVKDSGLYHNDAFFPDLTEETHSSIIRGRDYEESVSFFRKLKTAENIEVSVNLREGNSYEIMVKLPKKDLEPQTLIRKINRYFAQGLSPYTNSDKKIKEIKDKINEPFVRNVRVDPLTGLKEEVFKKGQDQETKTKKQSLTEVVQDFLKGTGEKVESFAKDVEESTKEMVEKMQKETYTEKNADEKMKKKKEENKKKGEEEMKENQSKNLAMEEEVNKKLDEKKENEDEYQYNE